MPEEPTDPETFDEYLDDALDEENDEGVGDASQGARGGPDLVEVPEADAAEQRRELLRLHDTPLPQDAAETANPADAVEQSQVVDPGDEEYR